MHQDNYGIIGFQKIDVQIQRILREIPLQRKQKTNLPKFLATAIQRVHPMGNLTDYVIPSMAQKIMTILMTTRLPTMKYSNDNAALSAELIVHDHNKNDSSSLNLGIDNIDNDCDNDDASDL